jgi:hypothetical protein
MFIINLSVAVSQKPSIESQSEEAMTTDKPKWWQSWSMYGIVSLAFLVGIYVGSYLWLPETSNSLIFGKTSTFKHEALKNVFGPAGWLEAMITGEMVSIDGPKEGVLYFPDGHSTETVKVGVPPGIHLDP